MENKIVNILKIVISVIYLQTLFFKFGASPESVYIFTQLGMEPYGRIGSGIMELIAIIMLFVPRTLVVGSFFSLFIITGALLGHFTILGISVLGDHGLLFALALLVFFSSLGILLIKREEIFLVIEKLLRKSGQK